MPTSSDENLYVECNSNDVIYFACVGVFDCDMLECKTYPLWGSSAPDFAALPRFVGRRCKRGAVLVSTTCRIYKTFYARDFLRKFVSSNPNSSTYIVQISCHHLISHQQKSSSSHSQWILYLPISPKASSDLAYSTLSPSFRIT
jgi:hypothetical protein